MKKFICGVAAVCLAIGLISWIAVNHLTDKAKAGVAALLGTEMLADEVKGLADSLDDRMIG